MKSKQSLRSHQSHSSDRAARLILRQSLLEEFYELHEAQKRHADLRNKIVLLMNSGAAVEAGRLTAKLDHREIVRCSWPVLTKIYGPKWVENARAEIGPSNSDYLTVRVGGR